MKLLPTVMAQLTDDNPHVRSTGVHSEGEAHVRSAGAHNGGEAHDTTDRPLGGDTGCLSKKRKSRSHGTNTEVKKRRKQEWNDKKCGTTRLQTDTVCTCIFISRKLVLSLQACECEFDTYSITHIHTCRSECRPRYF